MRNWLRRYLGTRPDEERLVFLLFAELFLLGIGFNFIETAVFPLFLSAFSAATLPYLYIVNAIVVALLTSIYLRLGRRLSFTGQLVVLQGFMMLLPFAYWLGLTLGGGRTVVFALPILFQVAVNMGQIGFWTMTARLLNLRQSKRLFGLIGAGMWVAIVLTGFLIPLIVRLIGAVNLLLISTAGMAGALALLVAIIRRYRTELDVVSEPASTAAKSETGGLAFLRNPYILLMFGLTIVAWLSFYFVDNIFFTTAGAQFPTQEGLASFMGLYLAALGVFTLFNNLFLAGFVLNRFGVRVALFLLPASLFIVTLFFSLFGTLWGLVPLLFWLATLNRVLDLGLLFSVDQSAQTILYQPLPAAERTRIQTIDNGIVRMTAVGLAGGLLILLNRVLAANVVQMSYVLLAVLVVWLAVVWLTARAYPQRLAAVLRRRRLSGVTLSLDDNDTVSLLRDTLRSPRPGSALYALDILAKNRPELVGEALPDLLRHPSPQVRLEALRHVETLHVGDVADLLAGAAENDSDPRVRGAACRALTAADPASGSDLLARLESAAPVVLEGALIGLRRNAQNGARAEADGALHTLLTSSAPTQRLSALRVLSDSFTAADCDRLAALLADGNVAVRRAALQLAGRAACPELWPAVVAAVGDRAVRHAAAGALTAGGEAALPAIAQTWSAAETADETVAALALVCGRIGGSQATQILLAHSNHPSDSVRLAALAALSQAGYVAAPGAPADAVRRQLRSEVQHAAWLLAGLRDGEGIAELDYLNHVLLAAFDEARQRVLWLASLVADQESLTQARNVLAPAGGQRGDDARRAYALELLELRLPTDLKGLIMPLFEELSVVERLQRLGGANAWPRLSPERRVAALALGDAYHNRWLQISALHAAGLVCHADAELSALLDETRHSADPILRETSAWAVARLATDPSAESTPGEKHVLSTIEKVIILKDVELFGETPDELLAEIAGLLTEVEVAPGEPVFAKGDVGDSLYVIVSGQVRVHDAGMTINHLGESEVFGEMALLDTETRMAAVTAESETLLLRLDQEAFYELMDTRSEVARGIIRVLSARLRRRVAEVAALRDQTIVHERTMA